MIEVQHLSRRYGPCTAVDDVSFKVERGGILGFLGPNGAGKTTTMRVLTGYMPATDGAATVAGYDVFASPRFYAINILSSEQEGHSNQYAKKGQHELSPEHFSLGKHGSPIIRDALVSFECELEDTHEGGDHLIIVGRVRDMQQRSTGEPLLFFSGGYRELR